MILSMEVPHLIERVLRGLIALLEAKSLYFNGSFESVMLWRTSGSVLALFDR